MKEQDIELRGTRLAKAMGWIVHKLEGGTGEPDKIYTKEGRVFYVEWKKPGGAVRDGQLAWETKIKASGTPHFFIDNEEKFRGVLARLEKRWFDANA